MQSAQYAMQDRIPKVYVNNSRKFATPQGDLLTDHLFTEFKWMSEELRIIITDWRWEGLQQSMSILTA